MAEGLKLVVGADVTQAEKALAGLTKEVQTTATVIDKSFNKGTSAANAAIAKIPAAAKPALAAVSKLGDSLETLRAKLLARQSFLIQEKDIAKVALLNKEIAQLEAEITRVSNAGKVGFDNLGNSLTKASGPMNQVAAGAGKAFGALRTLAYLIPGIGIAGLIGGLSDLVIGLFKTSDAFDEGAVAAARYKTALNDAKNSLFDFFTSGNDIEKLRNKLKFGESLTTDLLNFKVDKTANDQTIKEANQQIADLIDRVGFLRSNAAFILSKEGRQLLDAFPIDIEIPDEQIDKLSKSDEAIIREIKVAGTRIDTLQKDRQKATDSNTKGEIQSQIDANEALRKARDKALQDQRKYISDAKELAKELEKLGFIQPKFSFFDSVSEQFQKAQKVFADFNSRNLKINPKFFDVEIPFTAPRPDAIQPELDRFKEAIQQGLIDAPPVEIPAGISEDLQQVASVIQGFQAKFEKAGLVFKIPATLDFSGTGSNANAVLQDEFDKQLKLKTIQDRLNAIVERFSGDIFVGLGQAIGDAIGGSANVFDALFKVIAAGMKQFGEALIAIGTAKLALDKLFKGPQGGILAIGAGIALIALSTVVSNFQGPKFAKGGLVTGPTLGLVGEGSGTSQSNPEVIAPLDKLKGMLGDITGGSQTVVVMGKLRGRDIALGQSRTSKSQRRLGVRA